MKKHIHLFFDLDHTLWDTDRNAEESLRELFEELNLLEKGIPGFDSFHSCYRAHNEKLWGLYAENKVGKDAVRLHRFQHTLHDFNVQDDTIAHTLADAFVDRTPHKRHLIPGAMELLSELHGKYKLHIITNGFKEAQHTKLNASSIGHFFEHVIISEEVGVHKPDPRIFHHAIKLSGAAHSGECMMIGDTFQTDVFGALNAGFTAVHYAPNGNTEHESPVITIRHLAELLDHLNKN